jgi:hypothetical protein
MKGGWARYVRRMREDPLRELGINGRIILKYTVKEIV